MKNRKKERKKKREINRKKERKKRRNKQRMNERKKDKNICKCVALIKKEMKKKF